MTVPMRVRASKWSLLYKCAASPYEESRVAGEDRGDEPDPLDPADAGTLAHAAIAKALRGEPVEIDELPEEIRKPVGNALALWHRGDPEADLAPIRDFFGACRETLIEYRVQTDELGGGTLDVGGYRDADKTLFVLDWKTGHVERDHTMQLARYANRLASDLFGGEIDIARNVDRYVLLTVYPRLWAWTSVAVEPWRADQWLCDAVANAGVAQALIEAGGPGDNLSAYTEGSHCALCRGRLGCAAKTRLIRRVASVDLPELQALNMPLTHGELRDAYLAKRWLAAAEKELDGRIKEYVRQNGPVDLGDGTSLAFTKSKPRREVDTGAAFFYLPLLEDADGERIFGPEEIARCFKGSVGEIEKVVRAAAPPKKGKAMWEEVEERLRVAEVIKDGEPVVKLEPVANAKLLANNP